jgi:hypothetical protein
MSSIQWTDDLDAVAVDVYRSDDYLRVGRIAVTRLLRSVFEPLLGRRLGAGVEFRLHFHAVRDPSPLRGLPQMVNLRKTHGYATVQIVSGTTVLYRHPHAIREILAAPLQRLLARHAPEVEHWGFGVSGPGLTRIPLVRPAPAVPGSATVPLGAGRPRRIHVQRLSEPSPETAGRSDFGVTGEPRGGGGLAGHAEPAVVLADEAFRNLTADLPFSDEVEDGGFLIGHLYADRDRSGGHLVHVTHALPAERTGASMLQFTYTGESFLRINDTIAGLGGGRRLIGWYHTHLFPAADDDFGLSTIDVDLHTRTFLSRWQVAALVNLDQGERLLRIYAWDGRHMCRMPYWVGDR